VWSLLSDWCNFSGIPLAAWELGEKTAMWAAIISPDNGFISQVSN
jgi:hypothetical protein